MKSAVRVLGILILLAGSIQGAQAQIYRCVDASGHSTYTNDKEGHGNLKCTLVQREVSVVPAQTPTRPAAKPAAPAARSGNSAAPTPGSAARGNGTAQRVDPTTQKARDGDRRRILEEELRSAEQALDTARKNLAAQEAVRSGDERNYQRVLDRLKPFQDEVRRAEDNVAALKRELSNLR